MSDSRKITNNLLEMYGRDDWVMRFNFRCFLRISGLRDMPLDSKILDCGCAMGHFIRELNSLGFKKVYGLDAASEMVESARITTKAEIIHGDALDITKYWGPSSLDVVVASDIMHHLSAVGEWETFLSGCNKVLKKNGRVIFREPYPTFSIRCLYWMSHYKIFYVGFLKPRLKSFVEEDALLQYFFKHWVKGYRDLISRHGFEIIKDLNWFVSRITVARKKQEVS